MKTNRTRRAACSVGLSLLAGAGLGAVGASPAGAKEARIAGPASFVRVLHAISGGPKVDVYIDGKKQLNDYTYGGLSKYLRLSAGYHAFSVRSNDPARTVLAGGRTLSSGGFYTIAAYGVPSRPRLLTFQDSGGSVAFNQARLTVFHLSPNTPPLEVLATVKATGRTYRLFNRLRYGQIRASYVPAVPMTIRLRVNGHTIKTITGVEPRAGRKYAAYAIGNEGQDFKILLDVTASQ